MRPRQAALREEASRLAADADDRREIAAIAAELDPYTPDWPEEETSIRKDQLDARAQRFGPTN